MRYRLRTLLIATALGPPLLAATWFLGWAYWHPVTRTELLLLALVAAGPLFVLLTVRRLPTGPER
jgi:hypothetical protein